MRKGKKRPLRTATAEGKTYRNRRLQPRRFFDGRRDTTGTFELLRVKRSLNTLNAGSLQEFPLAGHRVHVAHCVSREARFYPPTSVSTLFSGHSKLYSRTVKRKGEPLFVNGCDSLEFVIK